MVIFVSGGGGSASIDGHPMANIGIIMRVKATRLLFDIGPAILMSGFHKTCYEVYGGIKDRNVEHFNKRLRN